MNWDSIIFNPYFKPELDFVKTKHPTPYGLIESIWERKGQNIEVFLKLPVNIRAKIQIPGLEDEVKDEFRCILKM